MLHQSHRGKKTGLKPEDGASPSAEKASSVEKPNGLACIFRPRNAEQKLAESGSYLLKPQTFTEILLMFFLIILRQHYCLSLYFHKQTTVQLSMVPIAHLPGCGCDSTCVEFADMWSSLVFILGTLVSKRW